MNTNEHRFITKQLGLFFKWSILRHEFTRVHTDFLFDIEFWIFDIHYSIPGRLVFRYPPRDNLMAGFPFLSPVSCFLDSVLLFICYMYIIQPFRLFVK